MKTLQIHSRLDHYHTARLVIIIETVLLSNFLLGTGDDHCSIVQSEFLGLDALVHVILIFDTVVTVAAETGSKELLAVVPIASVEKGAAIRIAPDGPAIELLPLPYAS